MSEPSDPSRRSRLLGVKLKGLVGDQLGETVADVSEFEPGAALRVGDVAWVLLADRPARRLGAALAWAIRHHCRELNVIAEDGAGVLARRAAEFDLPISVWRADGRSLSPAAVAPYPPSPTVSERHDALRELILRGGAVPIVEHGVLVGEVAGLEVCRVVDDDVTGEPRLEVGVGAHDREAFQMLHGETPTADSLARVVASVARHRRPDAPQHPLKTLAAERLIRWRIEQRPDLVGATVVTAAAPPVVRDNLKDPVPCVATGLAPDGTTLVVVCSVGIDLDLIPYAADARRAVLGGSGTGAGGLVVATPSRDRIPLVGEIAARLRQPASFVSVD